jgi:putative serine protease PepD
MSGWRAGGLALLVVVSMLIGGLVTVQVVDDGSSNSSPPAATATEDTTPTSQPVAQTPADGSIGGDVAVSQFENLPDLVESASQSVALIQIEGSGEGSGIVLDTDGHILTNYHVVEEAVTGGGPFQNVGRLIVHLQDGSASVAEVLGVDPSSDLAVIQTDFDSSLLHPATFGNSDDVRVGDAVFAIGDPFANPYSVTSGIVSAIGRSTISSFTERRILNVIQTDAALNPGNSGGPLFNAAGEVIGINTSITGPQGFRGSVGLGFAVPSNVALRYMPQLVDGDDIQHTQLGVSGGAVDEVIAADDGLSVTRGFLVGNQVSGSAAAAGVQPGDVITDINGVPIETFEDLAGEIDSYQVGDEVTLSIVRGNSDLELTATLQAWVG